MAEDHSTVRVEGGGPLRRPRHGRVQPSRWARSSAAAAKNYLVDLGVGSDRMTTISYGEELPICQRRQKRVGAAIAARHFVPAGG